MRQACPRHHDPYTYTEVYHQRFLHVAQHLQIIYIILNEERFALPTVCLKLLEEALVSLSENIFRHLLIFNGF